MGDLLKKLKIEKTIKEIRNLQSQVPKDGTLPEDDALLLHVKFWSATTMLTDILTKAKRYEVDVKFRRNKLLNELKGESDEKSEAAKERVAKSDKEWQKLQKERIEVQVLREWLELKRHDFSQAHIMAREVLKLKRQDFITEPK